MVEVEILPVGFGSGLPLLFLLLRLAFFGKLRRRRERSYQRSGIETVLNCPDDCSSFVSPHLQVVLRLENVELLMYDQVLSRLVCCDSIFFVLSRCRGPSRAGVDDLLGLLGFLFLGLRVPNAVSGSSSGDLT